MNPNLPCAALLLIGLAWLGARPGEAASPLQEGGASAPAKDVDEPEHPTWAAFEMAELERQRAKSGRPWLEFLDLPTLSTGLYRLPAGGVDPQGPHPRDEVYHVVSGRARLSVGEDEVAVSPGAVVFVKAGVPHRFHSIEEDLEVLVFFSAAVR